MKQATNPAVAKKKMQNTMGKELNKIKNKKRLMRLDKARFRPHLIEHALATGNSSRRRRHTNRNHQNNIVKN
jgi:hypothetical protein